MVDKNLSEIQPETIPKKLKWQRFTMNMKAVHIQCLDDNKRPIQGANASGFIVKEEDDLWLYTCWHVVTGYNMHKIKIGRSAINRRFLEVNLQDCKDRIPGVQAVGGNQSVTLPLYDEQEVPLWTQNKQDVPHPDLNTIHLKVPLWHDAIKLKLPSDLPISDMQVISKDMIWNDAITVGEKIYIVGYPYGYSALGLEQPTAVTLTRFLAADRIEGRHSESLLDGPGSPGMSGGPAFIEYEDCLYLCGIYTGLIYPDHIIEKNEKTTALGTLSDMVLWWRVENE